MTESVRKRVLLVAFSCSPWRGSEPDIGWNRALQAARYFDTWVICRTEFSENRRRYFEINDPVPGLTFVELENTGFESFLSKCPGGYYLAGNLWHRRAFKKARQLHEQVGFDLTHLVNFGTYREPGYLWKLAPPSIWGPWGGTQNFPWKFLPLVGMKGFLSESIRNIVNSIQLRFDPRIRKAAKKVSVLLASNSANQQNFAKVHGIWPRIMDHAGITAHTAAKRTPRSASAPLRILWSGRFEPFKALPLLLLALARVKALSYQLRILGKGPQEAPWRKLARRLGIDERIEWLGWIPMEEVEAQNLWADVSVTTSMRETSPSTVVLEALAAGVPVIGLDHQGNRDTVTEQSGILVPVESPRQVIDDLANVIRSLAENPARLEGLSKGAAQKAESLLWPKLGDRMARLYDQVLSHSKSGVGGTVDKETERAGEF